MTLVSTQITNIITDVGFPIAAFVLMYNMANGAIKELKIAVNNLTLIITERLKC